VTVLTQTRDQLRTNSPRRTTDLVTYGLLALALISFAIALRTTNQDAMNGYGLISVLGPPFFAALVLVCAAGAREFTRRNLRDSHLAAVTVVLVVILFGIQNGSDSAAGFSTAWLHVGFADYIGDTGQVLHGYDARFSWPGFFGGTAALVSLAGIKDAVPLLRVAPVAYNLLALIPLVVIAKHAASRKHVAWLGVLLYYCANWFEQDYFAPQATNLVLYLVTIGVLLWLGRASNPGIDVAVTVRVRRWWNDGIGLSLRRLLRTAIHERPPRVPGMTAGQYVIVESTLVIIIAASVVSHQLTPVAIILALISFSITGRTRYKGLWIIAVLTFVGWFSFGATDYWFGHLNTVIGDIGKVGSTINSGVSARVASGDAAHLLMQKVRLLMSAGIAVLAVVGLIVRRRSPWLPLLAALAFGPFALLALQSYGGEVVIRCFLFATPMLAILAAESVRPVFTWSPARTAAATMVILVGASMFQVAARGANQPFERITADQVHAVRELQSVVTPDTTIGYFNDFSPLALLKPGSVSLTGISDPYCANGNAVVCALQNEPDYIFASSSQAAYGTLVGGEDPGWATAITEQLVATGRYRPIINTPHVTVLKLVPSTSTARTQAVSR